MTINFTEKRRALDDLSKELLKEPIPTAEEWSGADVIVTSNQPRAKGGGFYPDPRYVVAPNAKQLSWLFVQLRDIFSGLYDSASKVEFFGRLANAALRYQSKCKGTENSHDLLFAVLHEAYAMFDEMEEGKFEYLLLAPGNAIADDFIERAESRGFVGIEETEKFFAERGIDL
ncbi:MAG: hypothetical protein MN733_38260 [Nitrososphaera sp.]|nr:hypothetical protein [Nitrososphaera sp.]